MQIVVIIVYALISIHALLAESDALSQSSAKSTPEISIHALLAESDSGHDLRGRITQGFLSTLSLRRATVKKAITFNPPVFLSTLSLRRATSANCSYHSVRPDFYPRSPCGERRRIKQTCRAKTSISIHALLAESDANSQQEKDNGHEFLSTLSLRRATPRGRLHLSFYAKFLSTLSLRRATVGQKRFRQKLAISIHALLAESDRRGAARVILII